MVVSLTRVRTLKLFSVSTGTMKATAYTTTTVFTVTARGMKTINNPSTASCAAFPRKLMNINARGKLKLLVMSVPK